MKKIMILSVLIFLVLTSLSFAAQKTIIQYLRAGDMGAQIQVGDENFVFTGTAGAITGDLSQGTLSFGNNLLNSSGSYWYGGDADICYCVDGKCKFGIGVRLYYEFTITTTDSSSDSTAQADGYGFSIVNGTNNSKTSTGGAPAGISMGELLGYAGPGRSDSLGLRPPKMGIEFDTYPNYGESDICKASSRNDPTDNKNHMALMYWGDNLTGNCTSSGYSRANLDDNRHGNGGGSGYPPANSNKSDGTGGFYAGAKNGSYNWLEDNTLHRFRLEIIRAASPNVDGTYSYTTKAWVDCAGCSDSQLATFKDLTVAYSDLTPQINRTVTLTAADHQAFDTMLFGWSEATGLYTQTIKFKNFNMFCAKSTCAYGTKPLSASYPTPSAYPGEHFDVYSGTGCAWTALSNASWITGVSPASGTGNGTVTYNVAANLCQSRIGTISIGDQLFTVEQANGTSSLSITTESLPNGRRNVAYSSTTVAASGGSTPYTWIQTGLPAGLSINSSTGVISGTPTAGGLFNPIITVTDLCSQTASSTYNNVIIKYDTYTIRNNTGWTIYRQSGGGCSIFNGINNGSTYSIPYNSAAVTFYSGSFFGGCTGSSISITGAQAESADADYDGRVRINSAWQLLDD